MGIDPPFLYSRPASYKFDAQSTDRGFNPRAATDASWIEAQRLREKRMSEQAREGPLIDKNQLNRHPDSYMVITSSYLDFKPLSTRRKTAIKWARWIQLAFRVVSLIGSIGLLVCLIFIKAVGEPSDWLLRIPPGIAIIHSLYAVWHLAKRPGARTPASTASYFIFACIFDAGLVPFMVYTTLGCRNEWLLVQDNVEGHWTTLFGSDYGWPQNTLQAAWLTAASLGCIWIVTFLMCVYLAMQFRNIANLPPDMNPFEENLTARSNSKHKKTKSTITQITDMESNRDSMTGLLNEKGPQVPWMHTRNGSTTSLGSSPPRSPRHSRYDSADNLTPPRSPYRSSLLGNGSPRNSTTSVNTAHRRHGHARTDSTGEILLPPSPNKRHSNPPSPYRNSQAGTPSRSSALAPGHRTESPAAASIYHSARGSQSTLHLDTQNQHATDYNQHNASHNRTTSESDPQWPLSPPLNEGTWLTSGSPTSDNPEPIDPSLVPAPLDSTPPEFRHLRTGSATPKRDHQQNDIATLPSQIQAQPKDRPYLIRSASKYDYRNRSPKPLGMNPPTPPVDPAIAAQAAAQAQAKFQHENGNANGNGTYRSNRANRASRVRQALSVSGDAGNKGYTQLEVNIGGAEEGDWVDDFHTRFINQHDQTAGDAPAQRPILQSKWSTPGKSAARVISSGFEEKEMLGMRQGVVRERQVSGKVVEEGRGGMQGLRAEMGWV